MMLLSPIAALLLGSTHAQSSAPTSADPIVVEGVRNRDRQITNFVKQMTPTMVHGQISRFEVPVCPVIIGLRQQQADYLVGRLRRVAAAVGMRVGKPRCDPNVIVAVVPNKAQFLGDLRKFRPEYFPSGWNDGRVRALQRQDSPVAAWHLEGSFWADGRPVLNDMGAGGTAAVGAYQKTIEALTRLRPAARKDALAAIVVLQGSALTGLNNTQVADYIAMRAFASTNPQRGETFAAPTILTALDAPIGSLVPLTLTSWDVAFLKALYASRKNSFAEYQRSEMKLIMKQEQVDSTASRLR